MVSNFWRREIPEQYIWGISTRNCNLYPTPHSLKLSAHYKCTTCFHKTQLQKDKCRFIILNIMSKLRVSFHILYLVNPLCIVWLTKLWFCYDMSMCQLKKEMQMLFQVFYQPIWLHLLACFINKMLVSWALISSLDSA